MNKEQKKLPINLQKNIFIILLLLVLLINTVNGFNFNTLKEVKFLNISILNWIVGYFISFVVAYVLHYVVYRITLKSLNRIRNIISFGNCFSGFVPVLFSKKILFFITPDYMFAGYFKELLGERFNQDYCDKRGNPNRTYHNYKGRDIKCEYFKDSQEFECEVHERKRRRKLFILCSNWANIILVSVLTMAIILANPQGMVGSFFKECIFTTIILHTFSRIIEITYAFYHDVVSSRMTRDLEIGEKYSTLKRGNRISLAVHSYLEVALLFAIIYYVEPSMIGNAKADHFFESLLYSFSVSAFNFSFDRGFTKFGEFFHVIQVFTNITLVVLSIANYLGMEDKMSQYEKADWEKREYI
jgi:hypothetical protein